MPDTERDGVAGAEVAGRLAAAVGRGHLLVHGWDVGKVRAAKGVADDGE